MHVVRARDQRRQNVASTTAADNDDTLRWTDLVAECRHIEHQVGDLAQISGELRNRGAGAGVLLEPVLSDRYPSRCPCATSPGEALLLPIERDNNTRRLSSRLFNYVNNLPNSRACRYNIIYNQYIAT